MENLSGWQASFAEPEQPQWEARPEQPPRESVSTRSLQLVIREDVTDTNRFFGRLEKERLGYDVAIFRRGICAGWIAANSVTTSTELVSAYRSRVKNGDVIYAIKHGSWHLEVSGTLKTSDGRSRDYTLDLTLSIINTRQFIEQYVQYSNQHQDPVELALRAIKGFLRQVMSQIAHDHMTEHDLINAALEALKYENNAAFGLSVNRADVLVFDIDPHLKELQDIQETIEKSRLEAQGTTAVDEIKARNEANQRLIAKQADVEITRLEGNVRREESGKDAEHEASLEQQKLQQMLANLAYQTQLEEAQRAKEERDARHEGKLALIRASNQAHIRVTEVRDEFIKELSRIRSEIVKNIRDAVGNDQQSIDEALEASGILELLDAFDRLAGSGSHARPSRPAITAASEETEPDFTVPPGHAGDVWPPAGTGPLPGIIKQDITEDPVLLISDLGLKLMHTSLGDGRGQLTGLGQDTAFLICSCATRGPAEQAHLQAGDILVTMNDIPLATLNDLARAVSVCKAGQEIPFLVLRDRALIPGTVKMPR